MIGQMTVIKFGVSLKQIAKKNGLRSVQKPILNGTVRILTGRFLTLQPKPVKTTLLCLLMHAMQNSKKSKHSAKALAKFLTNGLSRVIGHGVFPGSGSGMLVDGKKMKAVLPTRQANSP